MRPFIAILLSAALLGLAGFAGAQPPGGGKKDVRGKDRPSAAGDTKSFVDRMMAFDKNKDGKLTRDEVTDERLLRLFDRANTNKDGVVTREELEALAAKEMAGGGGSGPGGPGRRFGGPGARGVAPADLAGPRSAKCCRRSPVTGSKSPMRKRSSSMTSKWRSTTSWPRSSPTSRRKSSARSASVGRSVPVVRLGGSEVPVAPAASGPRRADPAARRRRIVQAPIFVGNIHETAVRNRRV